MNRIHIQFHWNCWHFSHCNLVLLMLSYWLVFWVKPFRKCEWDDTQFWFHVSIFAFPRFEILIQIKLMLKLNYSGNKLQRNWREFSLKSIHMIWMRFTIWMNSDFVGTIYRLHMSLLVASLTKWMFQFSKWKIFTNVWRKKLENLNTSIVSVLFA